MYSGYSGFSADDLIGAVQEVLSISSNGIIIEVVAIISATCVFSYLFAARSAYMLHAMPVNRTSLFVTNYISGFLFMAVPQFINFVIMILVLFMLGSNQVSLLLPWFGMQLIETFIFYTFSVFCGMLTGQLFAMPVFTIIFNYVVVLVSAFMDSMLETFVYGYHEFLRETLEIFSPAYYIVGNTGLHNDLTMESVQVGIYGGKVLICYAVVALVTLCLAFVMYQKRPMEMTGELLSFRFLRPIFRWSASFCASVGISVPLYYLFFYDYSYGSKAFMVLTVLMVISSVVSFIVAQMFVKRSFHVFERRIFREWFVFVLVSFAIMLSFDCDLYGIESKMPDAEHIAYISINTSSGGTYVNGDSAEEIEAALQLHKDIIDAKKQTEKELSYGVSDDATIDICYTMDDGSSLTRQYHFSASDACRTDSNSVAYKVTQYFNEPQRTYLTFLNGAGSIEKVKYGTLTLLNKQVENEDGAVRTTFDEVDMTTEQAQAVLDAVLDDMANGRMAQFQLEQYDDEEWMNTTYANELDFTITGEEGATYDVYCNIRTTSTKTLQALIDAGLIESTDDLTTLWQDWYETE
jgi:ABC-2 type transport system permease protein